jgi:hypothetical protein
VSVVQFHPWPISSELAYSYAPSRYIGRLGYLNRLESDEIVTVQHPTIKGEKAAASRPLRIY